MSLSASAAAPPPSSPPQPALSVRQARFTTRWEVVNGVRAQAVEVTLANLLPAFTLSLQTTVNTQLNISIAGAGVKTLAQGVVYRLVPGDQARVDVFVSGSRSGGVASVQIKDKHGNDWGTSEGWEMSPLIDDWTADKAVLSKHETPTWVGFASISFEFEPHVYVLVE